MMTQGARRPEPSSVTSVSGYIIPPMSGMPPPPPPDSLSGISATIASVSSASGGREFGEWKVRGDARAEDSLSLPHGYHERGAMAGCVPGATAVTRCPT